MTVLPSWLFCDIRDVARFPPRMSAAALSAAVDSLKFTGDRPHSQAEPTMQKHTPPNASRSSGGSAREGLLSEKPPPSHTPTSVPLFGRGGLGERRFSLEKRPLPQSTPHSSIAFARSLRAASLSWEPRRVTVGSTTVISFIWASTPFMVLTAEGPQEPFSIRPKVRF